MMGGTAMSNLEKVVADFLSFMGFMRNNFTKPASQITRLRLIPGHFHVLSSLYHRGSFPMSELGSEVRISKQQLTPIIDRLVETGMVTRRVDEQDRRIVRVEITEQGTEVYEELREEIKQSLMERFSAIPDGQLKELERMLPRVHEILKGADGVI
jgi:DNA-binding MarR family transcriptional regulator